MPTGNPSTRVRHQGRLTERLGALCALSPLAIAGLVGYGSGELARRLAACWRILDPRKRASLRKLEDLLPGCELPVSIPNVYLHDGSLSALEKLALGLFARHLQPRTILEIGTFNGATARLLAINAPDARVFTLDLPPTELSGARGVLPADAALISCRKLGHAFHNTPESARIVQLLGDSAGFDYAKHVTQPVDMAFIDGAHDHAHVCADTDRILPCMRSGGLILWHDYAEEFPGVMRCVNERFGSRAFVILGTRLALAWLP